jgi:hypothetical protein
MVSGIPARPNEALAGSAFAQRVEGLSGERRDAVTGPLLLSGDMPSFLRRLRPIVFEGHRAGGDVVNVTICVTPDYLAVGSDKDFVRVPMGLPMAEAVAHKFGFILPTTKMVDAIYAQADLRLAPRPLEPGPSMRSTAYFVFHNRLVGEDMIAEGGSPGMLVAGQKKDLVISNRLQTNPGRVAIYGWHREIGKPIQPLTTVHGEHYADYSHGVRLVSAVAFVDGMARSILRVLEDPQLAPAVSTEGPIRSAAILAPF